MSWTITGNPVALCDTQHTGKEIVTRSMSILQMTLSVTTYFPVHCGRTGSPDWGGDVPQSRLWVESRPRRLRPCGPVRSCGPVPFAVTEWGHTNWISTGLDLAAYSVGYLLLFSDGILNKSGNGWPLVKAEAVDCFRCNGLKLGSVLWVVLA